MPTDPARDDPGAGDAPGNEDTPDDADAPGDESTPESSGGSPGDQAAGLPWGDGTEHDTLREFLEANRTAVAVVGITLGAVAARLVDLGARVAQYDEAWIGYWILRYRATGGYSYEPIYHGPFLQHVNKYVFTLFGASDFTARLVVALLGGLLPLSALLLRERLRDEETVALALLFAATPLLLYYSRFMRSDVPLAVFAFLAVASLVAAHDRGDRRFLYAAGLALGLMATTKENFLLYFLAWVGAGAVVVDERLAIARGAGRDTRTVLGEWTTRLRKSRQFGRPAVVGAVLAAGVFVFFYAPRSYGPGDPGLWRSFTHPGTIPTVLEAATVETFEKIYDGWISGGLQGHPYIPYFKDYVATIWAGGLVVAVFAVVGTLVDRYGGRRRPLVTFATAWGAASVVGYPLANFLQTPWSTVHALVPLAVPAAVGVGYCYRRGRDSRLDAVVVGVVLLLAGAHMGVTAVETSYLHPQDGDSEVVYLSQSPADMKPTLRTVRAAIDGHRDGADVVYYGARLNLTDESIADRPPAGGGWHQRLPLAWYLEIYGASVNSTTSEQRLLEERPPVVVADATWTARLAELFPGYVYAVHDFSQIDKSTVILVDADRIPRRDGAGNASVETAPGRAVP